MKVSEKGPANKQSSSLKTLMKAYKEAILYGDEIMLMEIEAEIYSIENEKNSLIEQVATLSAEVDSGKQKYVRLQADFDNFRKRSDKERLNTRSDAQGEVIESLLLMVDSFERAKMQIKPETEKEININASYQGIYKQFVEIMRSLRVSVVPTVGKPFDPSVSDSCVKFSILCECISSLLFVFLKILLLSCSGEMWLALPSFNYLISDLKSI